MEPSLLASSPDKSDLKPSFRKPTSDAASRKYRRHSPVGRSGSSSSGGSPRRERSYSPLPPKEGRVRTSADQHRKDAGRGSERDSTRNRSSRAHDSQKHSERHLYGNSQDYRRHDDYSRHNRHADEDIRNYQRSSRSGRELRNDSRSDYTKGERISDRYRDTWHHSKDKGEISEHKNKNKGREPDIGNNKGDLTRDHDKISEQDQRKDKEPRNYKKDYRRSPGSHKNDQATSQEEYMGFDKDVTQERDTGGPQRRENEKGTKKDFGGHEDLVLKRKHTEREVEKPRQKHSREREEFQTEKKGFASHREREGGNEKNSDKASDLIDKKNSAELQVGHSELGEETQEEVNTKNADIINDVNSAKVAALKAAELVNRNLVGFGGVGFLSTDQKKKLLWGNKKNTSTEESSSRWDSHLFPDQDRQEKFNRLMSLRLPLWLWPIVGCEGHCGFRVQTGQQRWKRPCKETGGARYRSGEAIYCWSPTKRWSNSWSWLVMTRWYSLQLFSNALQTCVVKNFSSLSSWKKPVFHLLLNYWKCIFGHSFTSCLWKHFI
ncbi:uncharacterized protein LOC135618529 isoform X1 [Musa acuminata AAA Group]|uniref:uncharacterized protein LOC103977604 isoform X1 n=1 Tax=Musa acuminata AAA Group TaxID=214697 RepID=UPI0031DBA1F2